MDYAKQAVPTGRGGLTPVPTAPTLNERLNRALDRLETEGDRIERCLCRVNGTPIKENSDSPVAASRNLVAVVEGLENQVERMRSLSEGMDRIA
jgi:hypothetical protein